MFSHNSRRRVIRKVRGGNKDYPYGYAPQPKILAKVQRKLSVILQPALEDGVTHEVDATRDVELAHRVGFVDFDGLDAQGETGTNLFVAVAERNEAQDFRLAVTQVAFCLTARCSIAKIVHEFGRQFRIDVFAARGDGADGVDQFAWGALLEHVGTGACREQFADVAVVGVA